RIFARFCTVVNRPEWAADPRYANNTQRRAARPELVARIDAVLRTRTRHEWLAAFEAAGVPAGPINTVADLAADDALIDRGLFFSIPTNGQPVPQVGTGWHLDGAPNGSPSPPPRLGADTQRILKDWAGIEVDRRGAPREADG